MTQVTNANYDSDVVLDLETVGTSAGCGILSIGATTLDGTRNFYIAVDIQSCYNIGLYADTDTLAWWRKQSMEARKEAFSGTIKIEVALREFTEWYRQVGATAIWGNGADFDLSILADAYGACEMVQPWKYSESRCYRTVKALCPHITAGEFLGTRHDALADAVHEARHLRRILAHINEANYSVLTAIMLAVQTNIKLAGA